MGPKTLYLGFFGLKFESDIAINAWFVYFSPKRPHAGIFVLEFLKNYCQIWNQYPQVNLIKNLGKKQRCLNLGPKMPDLGI